MHDDGCDNCGKVAELYHHEDAGLAYCEDCYSRYEDGEIAAEDAPEGTFHAELRLVIEQAEGTPLALLVPHAQALLALPEESVAALVAAAQSMVEGASFGR